MTEAVDLKNIDHECPACSWRLTAIGFCIHFDDEGGREFFDAVPAKITRQEWREAREAERALSQSPVAADAPPHDGSGKPLERQLRLR